MATILSPFASKRPRISPTRPRCTAGFNRMRVRSMAWSVGSGARKIAAGRHGTARFLAVLALVCVAGCGAPRTNSVQQASEQRRLQGWQGEAERTDRELWRLQQQVKDDEAAALKAHDQAAAATAKARDAMTALHHELSLLQAAEQDLAAAKGRLQKLQQELATVVQQEQHLAEMRGKETELAKAVAAAEAAFTQQEKDGQQKLAALQQKLALLKTLDTAMQAAMLAAQQAGIALAPPAPPAAPPAAPAPAPGAPVPKK